MMIGLLFLVLVVSNAIELPTSLTPEVRFQQWQWKHNKRYQSGEEYNTRFNNFLETLKRIERLNQRSQELGSSATFGLTKFSDLSPAEFSQLLGMKNWNRPEKFVPSVAGPVPPPSWDWRNTTPPGITGQKNEGQCGSCWAMTVAMAIESAYIIHKKVNPQPPLSTQQIIDCDTNDEGCNGGMPTTAYQYVVSAGGLETNAEYPYTAQDGTCNVTKSLIIDPISGYELVIPSGSTDEMTMANFLATNMPISTAVDASQWQDYTGGVLLGSQCSDQIDHGIQLVGYYNPTTAGYWVIRNMWGSDWGENGFIRVQFGVNCCGLTSLPTYPTL
jgi:cathepsin F